VERKDLEQIGGSVQERENRTSSKINPRTRPSGRTQRQIPSRDNNKWQKKSKKKEKRSGRKETVSWRVGLKQN